MPDFSFENSARDRGFDVIVGVDEAGRGPWAGPVVAGAVVLDPATLDPALRDGLDDSKTLGAAKRAVLFDLLSNTSTIGVGIASVAEIDAVNILQATFLAMTRAVADLRANRGLSPDCVLVDGTKAPDFGCAAEAIKKGDGQSLSIAAASIVAKVSRDRIMGNLALDFPGYGWERNAGYGTAEHKEAIARLGVTAHHRRSFKPIQAALGAGRGG